MARVARPIKRRRNPSVGAIPRIVMKTSPPARSKYIRDLSLGRGEVSCSGSGA
jgi:hypothetical protein